VTRTTRRGLLAAAAALAAGCAEGTTAPEPDPGPYTPPETVRTRAPNETVQPGGDPPSGPYRRVFEAAAPSVAAVRAERGSGTAYAWDGERLVTNQHVVEDAERVAVQYGRDDWGEARVVATDVYADLAVLATPERPSYVEALPLVDYPPAVGQEAVVIGTPFGLRNTLTTGVVSGVDRSLQAATGFSVPGAVQTDAAVNPGNSGGPLLSLDGAVLGVVSAGGGENVGFGIPPQLVRRVVPALVEFGDYQHPFLGVTLAAVTPDVAAANDLPRAGGVIVVDVLRDGPADGVLRPSDDRRAADGGRVPVGGDVVVSFAGTTVASVSDLLTELSFRTFPGDEVAVRVRRDGSVREETVEVGVRPGP
jgi:S1-C subfamily serine protease